MSIQILSFTDRGQALGDRLAAALQGDSQRCNRPLSLSQWTARYFSAAGALIFVGAAGIAVRAIAPYVQNKATDPAVVVVDECGAFAVPILSGHLGGGNDLARQIASLIGAVPVITTATDQNQVFAVDEWARRQGCVIPDPAGIKAVSARLLAGETVTVCSEFPIAGALPAGVVLRESGPCDVRLGVYGPPEECLWVVPPIIVLGVGCRKNTSAAALRQAFSDFLARTGLLREAVSAVCSIDLKANEPGLLTFCGELGLPLRTFTAWELQQVPGAFSASDFVQSVTGVDNVCERSAVKGSGGKLIVPKCKYDSVTFAAAQKPFAPDWRWTYA